MLGKNYLDGIYQKQLNEEARQVMAGELADPFEGMPKKFHAVAKIINDGTDVVIYLPYQFVGKYITLEVKHCNALYITTDSGYVAVKGLHVDEEQNTYGASVMIPSEIMAAPLKKSGMIQHICSRNARKILIGNMLNKLSAPSQDERQMLRVAQELINDAIRSKGYTVNVQADKTIKLTIEI